MKNFALSLFVLCGLFEYGCSIMCYECNSAINSQCSDAVLPETLNRNCSEHDSGVTHTLCRKIVQHVDYGIKGQLPNSRVIRSCGWDDTRYKSACYHRAGYGGRQEVCSCTKDLCNDSSELLGSSALVSSVLLLTLEKLLCQ